jgi:HSP20 family protein
VDRGLDTERVQASYEAGVLTLRIPVAEKAKPRKIEITRSHNGRQAIKV